MWCVAVAGLVLARGMTPAAMAGESGIVTTRRFPMPYAQPYLPVSTIQQGGSNADWYSYNYGPSRLAAPIPACLPACLLVSG